MSSTVIVMSLLVIVYAQEDPRLSLKPARNSHGTTKVKVKARPNWAGMDRAGKMSASSDTADVNRHIQTINAPEDKTISTPKAVLSVSTLQDPINHAMANNQSRLLQPGNFYHQNSSTSTHPTDQRKRREIESPPRDIHTLVSRLVASNTLAAQRESAGSSFLSSNQYDHDDNDYDSESKDFVYRSWLHETRDHLIGNSVTPSFDFNPGPSDMMDEADEDALHGDEDMKTLSSILRNTFLGQNPGFLPRFDAQVTQSLHNNDVLPLGSDNDVFISTPFPSLAADKREEEIMTEDDGLHPEEDGLSVEERSWRCSIPDVLLGYGELPWTCRQRWVWRYLGEHVYPSRLYEARCEGRSCMYGHFNCSPITYTLHVLQVCLHGCRDQRVPYRLRTRWQWTDLNVTVGCQCVR